MRKIILLLLFVLLCVGCETPKTYETEKSGSIEYSTFVDRTTCVEYLTNRYQKKGGITVRYNQDGTIRVNEKCLKEKNNELYGVG